VQIKEGVEVTLVVSTEWCEVFPINRLLNESQVKKAQQSGFKGYPVTGKLAEVDEARGIVLELDVDVEDMNFRGIRVLFPWGAILSLFWQDDPAKNANLRRCFGFVGNVECLPT
jgi:hypothetical protein